MMIPRGQGIDSPTVHDLQREIDELKAENERLKERYVYALDIAHEVAIGMKDISKQMWLRVDALKEANDD